MPTALQQGTDEHLVRIAAPLRAQVEDVIRRDIADGALKAGDRLVERELCARFGVSRPLLREALRKLEAERLVEIAPHRGAHVIRPTLADAIDLYQVRAELEGLAARLAAAAAAPEATAALDDAVDSLDAALARGDADAVRRWKNAFYARLLDACGNPVLFETLQSLHLRIQLFRGAALAEPGRPAAVARELRAISRAVGGRDGAGARRLTIIHMRNAARALAAALARAEGRELTQDELARIDATPGFRTGEDP